MMLGQLLRFARAKAAAQSHCFVLHQGSRTASSSVKVAWAARAKVPGWRQLGRATSDGLCEIGSDRISPTFPSMMLMRNSLMTWHLARVSAFPPLVVTLT